MIIAQITIEEIKEGLCTVEMGVVEDGGGATDREKEFYTLIGRAMTAFFAERQKAGTALKMVEAGGPHAAEVIAAARKQFRNEK